MMTEVRGASNAKAKRELGWQPRPPELARGLRARWPRDRRARGAARRAAAGGLRDRLPDARQRGRGRGRGAGGAAARPRRARGGRADRVPARLRRRRWPRGSRSTSCARRGRAARATWASGCPSRWSPTRPTTRRATPRWPTRSRSPSSSCSRACRPEQRAVLLLRDVFDYGYDEIAEIVGKSEDNTRQLAARARRHVEERRPRFEASREQRDELARRFFAAAAGGRPRRRSRRCSPTTWCCTATAAARCPRSPARCTAAARVARTLLAWVRQGARIAGAAMRPVEVNGQPGALLLDGERQRDQRDGARHRRRPGPGRALDRQPGQAPPRRPGGRSAGAAGPPPTAPLSSPAG